MREIRKINGKKIWVEIPDKEPLIEVKKKEIVKVNVKKKRGRK